MISSTVKATAPSQKTSQMEPSPSSFPMHPRDRGLRIFPTSDTLSTCTLVRIKRSIVCLTFWWTVNFKRLEMTNSFLIFNVMPLSYRTKQTLILSTRKKHQNQGSKNTVYLIAFCLYILFHIMGDVFYYSPVKGSRFC